MKQQPFEQANTSADDAALSPLDEFLDVAGHELRNPLTAMKGQVQLFQRRLQREGGRERDLKDLDKIAYHIERLNQEIENYLAKSHVARRRLQVLLEPGDLVAIVERVVRIYAAGSSKHTFRLECAAEELHGMWDRRRVEQVMSVLLSNAVKYSPPGEVQVHLSMEQGVARIEVADEGVGVPPKERRAIFEAFTHGSNVENSGVGLGLFVARAVVKKHGGRMGLRPHYGGGSIFWVELPQHPGIRVGKRTRAPEPLVAVPERAAPVGAMLEEPPLAASVG